uniref:uncharacterized protein LOC122601065 n=1 Tax=Erigeron canadensis TaxID=72917 RepID=UPI001CB9D285|nr:uncharacterized protein LOC122601065 [Erigeron canadensis]
MALKTSQSKFSLKLMVHKGESRVIFAEVDSHFVDTLFSIMTLPMATILRLLQKHSDESLKEIGSINNLYESLTNLSTNCLSSEENKWLLLNPRTSAYDLCTKLKVNVDDSEPLKYYICDNIICSRRSGALFSTCNVARCNRCGISRMDWEIKDEDSDDESGGDRLDGGVFVSDVASFIVTDDLRVMPNASGCTIQLLRDLGINDVSELENRTFDIGRDQMLILLKGALLCKYPLTYMVFGTTGIATELVNTEKLASAKQTSKDTTTGSKTLKLKVTLQKSAFKFLFAEADSNFVEFLFGFLEIPLGRMIGKLMDGASPFESLNNLYASISSMSVGEYVKSSYLKSMLLESDLVMKHLSVNQIFPLYVSSASKSYCHSYLKNETYCAYRTEHVMRKVLKDEMFTSIILKDPRVEGCYLNKSAKFMLTDDLVISLSSAMSSIAMLGKLKVPLNDVEEHTVTIGVEEGLKLLEASFKSSSTLTDALLEKGHEAEKNVNKIAVKADKQKGILLSYMEKRTFDSDIRSLTGTVTPPPLPPPPAVTVTFVDNTAAATPRHHPAPLPPSPLHCVGK